MSYNEVIIAETRYSGIDLTIFDGKVEYKPLLTVEFGEVHRADAERSTIQVGHNASTERVSIQRPERDEFVYVEVLESKYSEHHVTDVAADGAELTLVIEDKGSWEKYGGAYVVEKCEEIADGDSIRYLDPDDSNPKNAKCYRITLKRIGD